MKRMTAVPDGLERFYSFRQICDMFGVSRSVVSRLFIGRRALVNLGRTGKKPTYRVPASLLAQVMTEHGYNVKERAAQ